MILDDKVPPPPYALPTTSPKAALGAMPAHILLRIVYHTFPNSGIDIDKPERSRKVLYWLSTSLRLTNRVFYTASMHVLRSTYLQPYQSLVRPPYSSDPFPASPDPTLPSSYSYSPSASTTSFLSTASLSNTSPIFCPLQRETRVLDRFIALKVREDVFVDDSELHLEREDYFRDLFEIEQPRARLEDLIRKYGFEAGAVSVPGLRWTASHAPSSPMTPGPRSLPLSPLDEKPILSNITFTIPASPTPSYASLATSPRSPPAASPVAGPSNYRAPAQPANIPPAKPLSKFASFFTRSSPSRRPPASQAFLEPPPRTPPSAIQPIPFSALTISLSPRRVGLVLNRSRTIVEVSRSPGRRDTLESLAQEAVRLLLEYLQEA